jgi:pyrroloquinoline quinone biosynthesis protein E
MPTARQARLAARFLAHRFRSLHPFEVQALLQNACDLRCVYCRCPEIRTRPLDTATWTSIITRLGELGCLRIKFQGGEPTLRRDLPELCATARRAGIVAAVVTNGQRIAEDPSLLDALDECVISIDGPDPKVHDDLRGPGTHARAVRALELAVERGIPTFVVMVVSRQTLELVEPMLAFCEARGVGFHAQPVAFGLHYSDEDSSSLGLEPETVRVLQARLAAWKRAGRPLIFSAGAYAAGAAWPDPTQLTRSSQGPSHCMAGRFYVHVEANGDVWPCQQHGDRAFQPANLVRDGVDEALRHAQQHRCGDCWTTYLVERKRFFSLHPGAVWESVRPGARGASWRPSPSSR